MPRRRRGSIKNKATSPDASAIACLPRDVLAGILLRLPASDLRRFRRVCKEWREVISDPVFVDAHMDHGPQDLTHTIVFFSGSCPAYRAKFPNNSRDFRTEQPHNGGGYLVDQQWQVTAQFTVSESQDMVGACNGMLCFLDVLRDAIIIVEPFTGEFITLPLPLETEKRHYHMAYCFGFDPSSRRYKLIHLTTAREQGLYVYTIGEGTNWRCVHNFVGNTYGYEWPTMVDGAVYWSAGGKLARFDLATEEVTSELIEFRPPGDQTQFTPVFLVLGCSDARVRLMGGVHDKLFIGEGAGWANNSTVRLPLWRDLTWPQPLQRGHLMLHGGRNGGMYAHPISPVSDRLGLGKLVLTMDTTIWQDLSTPVRPTYNTPGLFARVTAAQERRVPHKDNKAKMFCYAPPLYPAPLAHYFGKLSELHKL
jgi:hypothetical protein